MFVISDSPSSHYVAGNPQGKQTTMDILGKTPLFYKVMNYFVLVLKAIYTVYYHYPEVTILELLQIYSC